MGQTGLGDDCIADAAIVARGLFGSIHAHHEDDQALMRDLFGAIGTPAKAFCSSTAFTRKRRLRRVLLTSNRERLDTTLNATSTPLP